MKLALELSERQANRVLEQARRTQASVEIELRAIPDRTLSGRIESNQGVLLEIALNDGDARPSLSGVIGAYCEARLELSDQYYVFETFVVDASEAPGAALMRLATPDCIQVMNRRRHERTNATIATQVRLAIPGQTAAAVGLMTNISTSGLAVSMPGTELDDLVLLGDEPIATFELPGFDGAYTIPVIVCNKSLSRDRRTLTLGLEFSPNAERPEQMRECKRLRAALHELMADLHNPDGEP